jgi:thiamine transport system substrate-binding protein
MKRYWTVVGFGVVCGLLLVACGQVLAPGTAPQTAVAPTPTPAVMEPSPSPTETVARKLRVLTHDSFDISEDILVAFEQQHGVEVEILQAGDAGVMVNQAILSADNPLADVLYGIDNTLLSRALEADIFLPYTSPLLSEIPDDLIVDEGHRVSPVDFGDVCLNYEKAWFSERDLAPPADLLDLVEPEFRGLTVVESPATSSPGLAFLLTTVGRFGDSGDYTWTDYWADLRDNEVLIVEGWEDAYWGQFTYGSQGQGERPVVVSYASSPPVEVYFSEEPLEVAPTAAVVAPGSCFRQIEFVGILRGTMEQALAEAWIDYMLDVPFQQDIPLHMFVFPANQTASLPDVFVNFAEAAEEPVQLTVETIESNRDAWIQEWRQVALQ